MLDDLTKKRTVIGATAGPDGTSNLPTATKTPQTARQALGGLTELAPTPASGIPRTKPPETAQAAPNAPITSQMPTLSPIPAAPPQGQPQGVGLTPTDPNNPLTGQTIARDPLVDRFNLAQERFNTFAQATDPQYQSALRQAQRLGAASGGLGSGMLRTDLGNLAGQRDLQMRTAQQGFLQDALEGTIGDQFRDVGVAQQQQGFQNMQQQQAFENELRRMGFTDQMLNSAFGRALQAYMAGQTGGTGSGTTLAVGNQYQQSGQDALGALYDLIRGQAATGTP